ncbi:Uncharacterised protein [Vibrio cholerae]|nr:Uncharacterised protein [Vibrio cholerae]
MAAHVARMNKVFFPLLVNLLRIFFAAACCKNRLFKHA